MITEWTILACPPTGHDMGNVIPWLLGLFMFLHMDTAVSLLGISCDTSLTSVPGSDCCLAQFMLRWVAIAFNA